MADLPATPANDSFERHYAEKIWTLVPEVYRSADGEIEPAGRLRALIEIFAGQAAIARRSIDRLWTDSWIDAADDWAVPYIGGLVGARPVSALNRRGQRTNVGRTLHYRRRLGTVRLAERLAADIAGWDAVASEAFRRLARHWHMLDGAPRPGSMSGTPQWGYAELRPVRVDSLADRAHDDLSHFPDFRRHRGVLGRYAIAKVNLHLFRHFAFPLTGVTPVKIADQLYTLDPSGRDVALFQVGGRTAEDCRAARQWEMRAPIPCRRLNSAAFIPERGDAPAGLEDKLEPIYGRRFATEAALIEAANAALKEPPGPLPPLTDARSASLIRGAMEGASPRRNLLPGGTAETLSVALVVDEAVSDAALGPERLYAANLTEWGGDHQVPGWVTALVDPARGRVRLMNPLVGSRQLLVQRLFYGAFWPVGAGTHDRASGLAPAGFTSIAIDQPDWRSPISGERRFGDSRTFTPKLAADDIIVADGNLTLSADNGERPYVVLAPAGNSVTIRSAAPGAELVIDGLWIAVPRGSGSGDTKLRIDGTWGKVTLRNVTLDPGGAQATAPGQPPAAIPAVRLELAGAIDDIVIDRSITGRITEAAGSLDPCATDTVTISNSIVRSGLAEPAIALRNALLGISATTVFGDIVTGRIDASELLVDGRVLAEDQQAGCFRFSAAAEGSRTPHPYESHFFAPRLPAGTFVSRRFGDAGYAQLSEIAPAEIRQGGEDGVEIGAFKDALDPIKRADLSAKLREFMPINAIAQLIIET